MASLGVFLFLAKLLSVFAHNLSKSCYHSPAKGNRELTEAVLDSILLNLLVW
jgi:hypothetical protein